MMAGVHRAIEAVTVGVSVMQTVETLKRLHHLEFH